MTAPALVLRDCFSPRTLKPVWANNMASMKVGFRFVRPAVLATLVAWVAVFSVHAAYPGLTMNVESLVSQMATALHIMTVCLVGTWGLETLLMFLGSVRTGHAAPDAMFVQTIGGIYVWAWLNILVHGALLATPIVLGKI